MTPAGADRPPRLAWTLARSAAGVVFGLGAGNVLLIVWRGGDGPWRTGLAALLLAIVLGLQLTWFSRPDSWRPSPRTVALLALHAILAFLPTLEYGSAWWGVQTFFAGSALLVLPPVAGWALLGLALAGAEWLVWAYGPASPTLLAYDAVGFLVLSLNVYLLSRLAGLAGQLHAARDELARLAVAEERLRFARDLNDLLGQSVSAITLRGELAHRLLATRPERATREVGEIVEVARRALGDVRAAARSYGTLSLEQEASSARSLLAASDIDTRLQLDHTQLPVPVRTTLSAVLRERVTAILGRGTAEHCEITLRQTATEVTLDIVDDGAGYDATGVQALSGLGGTVTAGADEDGRFRLHASIPLAGLDPAPAPARRPDPPIHGRSTSALLVALFTAICVVGLLHLLLLTHDALEVVVTTASLAGLLALQLTYVARVDIRLRPAGRNALLLAQACLIYLPLPLLGRDWVSEAGLLAGSALLLLTPVVGWTVFAAVIGSLTLIYSIALGDPYVVYPDVAGAMVGAFIVFGTVSLKRLVAELARARVELARMAVAEERLRFARDLHDLLGLSLSAIALKAELTRRLLDVDRPRAAGELAEMLTLARRALADVRSVAAGDRELSLDEECRTTTSVLTAADVEVTLDARYDDLPAPVSTVLAVVLREAVTNVLRHSTADHCDIAIHQSATDISLDIANDGLTRPDEAAAITEGSGIRNLSSRMTELGGDLHAGPDPNGHFRLRARLPLSAW